MKRADNKGFTFIELILYMAILGIFMVAVTNLVGTTVASQKKQKSRQKLQTLATETYDSISNMLMGAKEVKVAAGDSTSLVSYVVKSDASWTETANGQLMTGGTNSVVSYMYTTSTNSTSSINAYNIEKAPATIEADVVYLNVSYSAEVDETTYATIKFDKSNKKLYLARNDVADADYESWKADTKSSDSTTKDAAEKKLRMCGAYRNAVKADGSAEGGTVLANNVTSFKVQINPEDNSVGLVIGFEDEKTGATYMVTGVVGIRNSFVLKQHEWN